MSVLMTRSRSRTRASRAVPDPVMHVERDFAEEFPGADALSAECYINICYTGDRLVAEISRRAKASACPRSPAPGARSNRMSAASASERVPTCSTLACVPQTASGRCRLVIRTSPLRVQRAHPVPSAILGVEVNSPEIAGVAGAASS